MITVHHLENSRSQRVLWLLEELGTPYEVRRYERDRSTRLAPAELKAVHPLGKSPVITDDGQVLAETGAIVETLIERYGDGRFVPVPGTEEHARHCYWMHAAEGTAMPLLVMLLLFGAIEGPRVPFLIRPITRLVVGQVKRIYLLPSLDAVLSLMEQDLAKSTWFAGEELTGADFLMIFPAEAAAARADLSGRPRIRAFLDRVHARPAYQRALERGGPYELMA